MARYKDIELIIEFIRKGLNNPDKTKAFGHDAIEILTEIEYAPTADVAEVRHALWRENKIEYLLYGCSNCGCRVDYEFNYCPECGAKMDGCEEE